MLVFPNSKINLGLHIIEKRSDGFHNIETVFYPVNWCDALEIIENKDTPDDFVLSCSGKVVDVSIKENIIYKTWELVKQNKKVPPVKVHLHKNIPMGAGLGGGSSDAAFFINAINTKFELGLSWEEKFKIASQLGSDCAFFLKNTPCFATGKGNEFSGIACNLSEYYILLVYPNIHSNTAEAYKGLLPAKPKSNLKEIIAGVKPENWKGIVTNDFEDTIFKKYPEIEQLKNLLYKNGALYASLSGSGSSVFGIFNHEPKIEFQPSYEHCLQKPKAKVL